MSHLYGWKLILVLCSCIKTKWLKITLHTWHKGPCIKGYLRVTLAVKPSWLWYSRSYWAWSLSLQKTSSPSLAEFAETLIVVDTYTLRLNDTKNSGFVKTISHWNYLINDKVQAKTIDISRQLVATQVNKLIRQSCHSLSVWLQVEVCTVCWSMSFWAAITINNSDV